MSEKTNLFDKENRIYKYYINNLENLDGGVDFVKSLFELEIIDLDKSEKQDLVQLYEILGFDKFFELITFYSSKTIKIPNIEKIKKLLVIAIAYYQIEILDISPKEAGKILGEKLGILNLKQKNIKALVNSLQQVIDKLTETTVKNTLNRKQQEEDLLKQI